jgi:hypothetical protein
MESEPAKVVVIHGIESKQSE